MNACVGEVKKRREFYFLGWFLKVFSPANVLCVPRTAARVTACQLAGSDSLFKESLAQAPPNSALPATARMQSKGR